MAGIKGIERREKTARQVSSPDFRLELENDDISNLENKNP
jgi:hypothetical protein